MTRPSRVCIEPRCPALATNGSRCAAHKGKPWANRNARRCGTSGWAWQRIRQRVLQRDHHRCRYCSGSAEVVDHVVSRAAGGSDDESNLVAACKRCNEQKRRAEARRGRRSEI